MSSIAINRQPTRERGLASMLRTERSVHALALLVVVIVAVYLIGQPTGTAAILIANGLFTALPTLAAFLCFRTARQQDEYRLSWLLFGVGCATWLSGQLIWNWYTIVLRIETAYPSPADIPFGLFYPLVFAGFVVRLRRAVDLRVTLATVLDSLILVSATALIVNEIILETFRNSDATWSSGLLLAIAWEFGALSLALLAGIALFVQPGLVARGPLGILIVSFLTVSVTDVVYNQRALNGTYTFGSLLDFGWYLAFVGFGVAAIVAPRLDRATLPASDSDVRRRSSQTRAALMVASVLVTTGMSAYIATTPKASPTMIGLVLVSGALLATRLGIAAIQTDYLERRTRERDRMAGVVSASNAISSTLDLDRLLPALAIAMSAAAGRARAEVYVFTEEMDVVESRAFAGFSAADAALLASLVDAPVGGYPAERRIIATLAPTPQWLDEPGIPTGDVETFERIGKLHTLVTPLVAHGRVVGVVDMWTPFDTTPFESADIAAAAAIGQQAGLAIHNARLLASTQRYATEQAALLRVSHAAVSSLDLNDVLAEIAQASLGVANAEACSIEIWDPEEYCTILAAEATIDDWPGTSAIGTRITFDNWPTSERVITQQITLNLLSTDDALSEGERAHLNADGTRSMLVMPLVVNATSLGILSLFSRNQRRFTLAEVQLAGDLAAQISIAIDRARLHKALRERADTDGLTGIRNHRKILETLDAEIARTRRGGQPLTIVMIDLDGFKQVNDTFGHQTGDQILRETAAFLRASIRDVDHVGRYGGDEFLLILPGTDADDARQVISRLLDLAEDVVITVDSRRFPIQLSAGIATTPGDGATHQELLAVADSRMYESKSAHRWILAGNQR